MPDFFGGSFFVRAPVRSHIALAFFLEDHGDGFQTAFAGAHDHDLTDVAARFEVLHVLPRAGCCAPQR
jgi:hypothetical protein